MDLPLTLPHVMRIGVGNLSGSSEVIFEVLELLRRIVTNMLGDVRLQ